MMVFYKIDYVSLIEIEVKLTHILESFMAYYQHLDILWPQQAPTKGINIPKIPQDIT
jgi:hypothetical protein